MISFLPYAKQSISQEDADAVREAVLAPIITRGPKVEEFERAIADLCGAAHAVAFNSASSALTAAYQAVGCNNRDLLLSTPNTFVTTIAPGVQCGARPLFVDIDRQSGNIDLEMLAVSLAHPGSRGRHIIVPVHFAGVPVDMHQLNQSIHDPDAIVIEDAAHALGSCYADGKPVGCCAYSLMTVFSFHPAKTITTGEGGMVTTNDSEIARRLRRSRNIGIERDPQHLEGSASPWYYEVQELSGNFHLSDIHAALGLSQLRRLDQFVAKRAQLVAWYREQLAQLPMGNKVSALEEPSTTATTAYHLFVVRIDYAACKTTRAEVMRKLHAAGIGTQVHYIPVYAHPYFRRLCGEISAYFPEMEAYYAAALSLPLHCTMEHADVIRVCEELAKALGFAVA